MEYGRKLGLDVNTNIDKKVARKRI